MVHLRFGHTELIFFPSPRSFPTIFIMVSRDPIQSLYIINAILSDIGNKRLGNPFKIRIGKQCDHLCTLPYKPILWEKKSDSETKSASSVWPGRYTERQQKQKVVWF